MPRPRLATIAQYVRDVRATLSRTAPELDTSVGTISRKIIDAVAEKFAEAAVDPYIQSYDYDLGSKQGSDLDEYVARFGFTRKPAVRATGTITLFRSADEADSQRFLKQGSEVGGIHNGRQVVFVTAEPAVIGVDETQVDVSIIATVAGEVGNVPAGTITQAVSLPSTISSLTNSVATTGGIPAESDASLRNRFRSTLFRNLAGTTDNLAGVALDVPEVSRVNVIGAKLTHIEQIEITGGTATVTLSTSQYIYPDSVVLAEDLNEGPFYVRPTNYTFDTATGSLAAVSGLPDGLYNISFEYIPESSRNSPGGPMNRVDIWVDGTDIQEATETLAFRTDILFSATANSTYYTGRFARADGTNPVAGNFFVPYALSPVVDPSDGNSVTIDGTTFTEDVDFWLVNDTTAYGNGPHSFSGIEIDATAATGVTNLSTFSTTYTYNEVPRKVEDAVERWRFPHNDVWAHQADLVRLRLYFIVIPRQGYTKTFIEQELFDLLGTEMNSLGFGSTVQYSDLLGLVSSTGSVDSVRFATSTDDASNYAIQEVSDSGTLLQTFDDGGTPSRVIDVLLSQRQLATLDQVTVILRAQNTFGNGA